MPIYRRRGLSKRLSINSRHLITDMNPPAGATRKHRHSKGRALLAYLLGQRRENRQITFTGFGIRMGGEAPGFRLDHVKFHGAYAKFSAYPVLLLPGSQPINRDV